MLGILAFVNPPEAVWPAAALLDHKEEGIRAGAARLLGSIGNDACCEPVGRALRDEVDHVSTWAAMGIKHALEEKRCTAGFLKAILEPLAAQFDRPDNDCYPYVSDMLLQIDRARAMSVFLSDRVFRADCEQLHHVLRAVNSAGEKIPPEKLYPLLQSLRPKIAEHPHGHAYAAALVALARSGSPDAESVIRKELTSEDTQIQLGAAEALAALNVALPPREYFCRRIGSIDYRRLTQPQRICYCIDELSMEVNNGGFSQYFFNPSGDHAADTLAALETVNAKATASMLRQAVAQFGPAGPSPNRDKRQDQLAAFSEEQDAALHRLDSEFFEYPDNLDALLALYAADHPEHFRSEQS